MDQREYLQALLDEQRKQEEQARAAAQEELASRLEASPSTIDWSPLAAQLDQWAGGDLASIGASSGLRQSQAAQKRIDELSGKTLATPKIASSSDIAIKLATMEAKDEAAKSKAALDEAKSDKKEMRQDLDLENKLRDDFTKSDVTKEYNQAASGISKLRSLMSSTNQGGGNDIALVYAFMKSQDPGSVVREGEYATAQKYAGSLYDKFRINVDRLAGGKDVLTPEQRNSLAMAAEAAFEAQQGMFDKYKKQYEEQAKELGLKPSRVVITASPSGSKITEQQQKQTPPPSGGLSEEKRKRLEELRAKKAAGQLGG
jgi:hypothetical protein